MKTTAVTWCALVAALVFAQQGAQDSSTKFDHRPLAATHVDTILAGWKAEPKSVAETLIAKYGQPSEASATRLIWFNSGPWKFTILTNEMIPHNFPKAHSDMLRQGINYKVADGKFNDLLRFDGSIIVDRTPGEMSARCDKEEMNFLAINLAHDVATGARTVADARDYYAKTATAFMQGSFNEDQKSYTHGFRFPVPTANTGFPDQPAGKSGG